MTNVHDTAVDVAELLEAKEAGAMGRVIEDVRLRCIYLASSLHIPTSLLFPKLRYGGRSRKEVTYSRSINRNSPRITRRVRFMTYNMPKNLVSGYPSIRANNTSNSKSPGPSICILRGYIDL